MSDEREAAWDELIAATPPGWYVAGPLVGGSEMRELDGMRILGDDDGKHSRTPYSNLRELVSAADTEGRWRLGEVTARPDEGVATHSHPGEPEAIIILDGEVELHGARGVTYLGPGDVVFVPADTEHGLRTPEGGRWLAIWPIRDRVAGRRYAG